MPVGSSPASNVPPACAKACSNCISSLNIAGHGESFVVETFTRFCKYAAFAGSDIASSTRGWSAGRPATKFSNTGKVEVTAT